MARHRRGRAAPWASVAGSEMVWEEVASDPETAGARSWGGVGLLAAGMSVLLRVSLESQGLLNWHH